MKSHKICHNHGPISPLTSKYFDGVIGKLECYFPCRPAHAVDGKDGDATSFLAPLMDMKCSWYRRTYQFGLDEGDGKVASKLKITKPVTEAIIRTNGLAIVWGNTLDGGNMSLTLEIVECDGRKDARVGSKKQKVDYNGGSAVSGECFKYVKINLSVDPEARKKTPLPTQIKDENSLDPRYCFETKILISNALSSKAIRTIEKFLQENFDRLDVELAFAEMNDCNDASTTELLSGFHRSDMRIHRQTLHDICVPRIDDNVDAYENGTLVMIRENPKAREGFLSDLHNWLGAVSCRLEDCLQRNEGTDNYASSYNVPHHLSFERHCEVHIVTFEGVISSKFADNLIRIVQNIIMEQSMTFCGVTSWPVCTKISANKYEYSSALCLESSSIVFTPDSIDTVLP